MCSSDLPHIFVASHVTLLAADNKLDKMHKIMNNARFMGIEIKAPHVRYSTNEATCLAMAPMLAAGTLVAAGHALVFALLPSASRASQEPEPGRAFQPAAALGLAAMMALMLVVSAAMQRWFGEAGVIAGAAVAGIVDTHSAGISVASLVTSGGLPVEAAIAPILAAMTTNAAAKIVMAISLGGRGFALRIIPGIALSMLAAWGVAWLGWSWG